MSAKTSTPSLCLGTAQFGMNYGINNFTGQPSLSDVFSILDHAIPAGINFIDTATAYGNAEDRLGQYHEASTALSQIHLISKLRPNLKFSSRSDTTNQIHEELLSSLRQLQQSYLYGYLLHTPQNFYNPNVITALQFCRQERLIKHFGVSIYETSQAMDIVRSGLVDIIQIPYNIFDTRLDYTDFFHIARENNVQVFARSIFIQGLLLMPENKLPVHLARAGTLLRKFDQVIERYGFTRPEAAFLFAYTHPLIDVIIFGVDTLEHLKTDLSIRMKSNLFAACREELTATFPNIERRIIIPSLWETKPN
ncbi:MAG TPA: aldo/keto reductase [Patescibacteria group bacterium]|nr:aldo/keto reductase [Patescibacteria group bacterium]